MKKKNDLVSRLISQILSTNAYVEIYAGLGWYS